MPSKMLIDAAHPEETRVVVVKGSRVEEFDYESANKKQLRGNIYLAKVTRVEPSLQAAFVDYGGNRHGFLAFNEIHPDYYQIPVADRQALLEEEAEEESRASAAEAAQDDAAAGKRRRRSRRGRGRNGSSPREEAEARHEGSFDVESAADFRDNDGTEDDDADEMEGGSKSGIMLADNDLVHEISEAAAPAAGMMEDQADTENGAEPENEEHEAQRQSDDDAAEDDDDADEDSLPARSHSARSGETGGEGDESVESVGSEDALEELPERPRRRRRSYKIQEVIRRRQIILVQVVKEERGNKGAALTTYLSLAGRYTVLMPNTARGGGISRKITQAPDRKRLREIADELEVPEGMGLIIRTAGAQRTKAEIKRDYDYLLRLWETVRDLTLKSTAPSLVYEEGSLIKRSIRDLYNKDIDEVLVAGDDAYREAKDFMRMLMPSHAKNVKPYKEPEPVFIRYKVERQLAAMFSPQVVLKSGGYIVINQTEALVAVDVNSGKATREHNIEDTALKTNLEASEEIARQLRLRDLAGLIVIDFIDMDERRNSRLVEKRMKDSLRNDRARIQVGRISPFGLLEMSRQRLRTGMLEGSTTPCQMCQGTGVVRSIESVSLDVLRTLEDKLLTEGVVPLSASTAREVALYILNQKRSHLKDIEQRYQVPIMVTAGDNMHGSKFVIERMTATEMAVGEDAVVHMDWAHHHPAPAAVDSETAAEQRNQRPRRRRRKRGGRTEQDGEYRETMASDSTDHGHDHSHLHDPIDMDAEAEEGLFQDEDDEEAVGGGAERPPARTQSEASDGTDGVRKPRRRGRRGGRRSRGGRREESSRGPAADQAEAGEPAQFSQEDESGREDSWVGGETANDFIEPASHLAAETEHAKRPGNGYRSHRSESVSIERAEEEPESPSFFGRRSRRPEAAVGEETAPQSEAEDTDQPRRRGWWQR